jgi:hypothetical protein
MSLMDIFPPTEEKRLLTGVKYSLTSETCRVKCFLLGVKSCRGKIAPQEVKCPLTGVKCSPAGIKCPLRGVKCPVAGVLPPAGVTYPLRGAKCPELFFFMLFYGSCSTTSNDIFSLIM